MMPPLQWVKEYAHTCDDGPSFRHIRSMIVWDLKHDAEIRATLSEEVAVAEWDPHFADIKAERERALEKVDARMRELGVKPHRVDELNGYPFHDLLQG